MSIRSLFFTLLYLSLFGTSSCGEDTSQPGSSEIKIGLHSESTHSPPQEKPTTVKQAEQSKQLVGYSDILSPSDVESILNIEIDQGLSKLRNTSKTSGAYFQKKTGYSITVSVVQQVNTFKFDAHKAYYKVKNNVKKRNIVELDGVGEDAYVVSAVNGKSIYVLSDNYYIVVMLFNGLINGDQKVLANLASTAANNLKRFVNSNESPSV